MTNLSGHSHEPTCCCPGQQPMPRPRILDGVACPQCPKHGELACSCPPAQIIGSGGDVIDQSDAPDCPLHGELSPPAGTCNCFHKAHLPWNAHDVDCPARTQTESL